MGAATCSPSALPLCCQSGTAPPPSLEDSSIAPSLSGPNLPWQADMDDSLFQEYDNPSRGILDHSFLKTSVNNGIQHQAVQLPDSQSKTTTQELNPQHCATLSSELPSIFCFESSELTVGKDEWAEVFPSQEQETKLGLCRKVSMENEIEEQSQTEESNLDNSIMKQVSDYMLSEKNFFEAVAISKEDFVRFRRDQIEKHYSFVEKIGEGSFGNVFKVYHKASQEFRAIKLLKSGAVSKVEHHKIMKQINILKRLDHPHILKIYEVFFYESNYYIVTEHCEGGSLSKYLRLHPSPSMKTVRTIFSQLVSALAYIHRLGVVHRDIKPDNIMLSKRVSSSKEPGASNNQEEGASNSQEEGVSNSQERFQSSKEEVDIRVIDFGLSKELKGKRVRDREKIGTFTYMSPEVLQGIYSTRCDMWSAGIVLMILITGRNSFKGKSKEETFERIKKESISFAGDSWRGITTGVKEMVMGLLQKDPRRRLSSQQVLNSKWLCFEEGQWGQEAMGNVSRKLYDYYRGNNFVSTIESYVAYMTTTETEIKEYAKLFWVLDRNRNGFIEKQELERAFMTSGLVCSEGQADYVLKKLETQPSGRINYTQFVTMLSGRTKLYAKQSLMQAFAYLDENSNGFIERSQLKAALKNVDCSQLSHILGELDENLDDRISMEQFLNYLNKDVFARCQAAKRE